MLKPTFTRAYKGNLSRPLAAMFLTDQIRLTDLCRRASRKYSCEFRYNWTNGIGVVIYSIPKLLTTEE